MASHPHIDDFTVTGNLAADPRKIDREDGSYLVVLAVAESRSYWDAQVEDWRKTDPVYYNVALDSNDKSLGNMPDNVLASVKKGDMVTVAGQYQATPYISNKTGEPGINHRIWAKDVSASMKFATVAITDNPKPSLDMDRGVQRDMTTGRVARTDFTPRMNPPAQKPEPAQASNSGWDGTTPPLAGANVPQPQFPGQQEYSGGMSR
ncbi:single-stranded DNA-binding protein [Rothia sp. P5764]|uniref:single-stranded DNA-binding protein n=1 Tax=Rothia sp. P5764 TaxID=3402654 RepID=UPI003AD46E46